MKKLLFAYYWIKESTIRTAVGITVLSVILLSGIGLTHAATSYDVSNEAQMFLADGISTTKTTGITIASPQANGTKFIFSTTTGGVLRIRFGNFREDIYYPSATVNPITNVITLGTVIRNICPQVTRAYISCGAGRQWGRGSIVELIQDARLFNLKANIDRANTFTASGAIAFSGSGSLSQPTFATTAARDQALGANPTGAVRAACVIATGLCYDYIGGTWTARTGGSIANGSTTVAGKFQLATVKDQSGSTVTGTTGAATVVGTQFLVSSYHGASDYGKIVTLDPSGKFGSGFLTDITYEFGTGADGNATISSTGALTSNKDYNNLTINSGVSLSSSGYIIRVKGTLTLNGKIRANGGNGSAGSTGTAGAGCAAPNWPGSLPSPKAGIAGGAGGDGGGNNSPGSAGTIGGTGTAETAGLGSSGLIGAAGGVGTTQGPQAGGSGGLGGPAGTLSGPGTNAIFALAALRPLVNPLTPRSLGGSAGSGGGGGGGGGGMNGIGSGGNGGGGGGSGCNGGNIDVAAKIITGSGKIETKGGNGGQGGTGGNGTASNGGGGGGGGSGGQGGTINLIYNDKSGFTGSLDVSGGSAGAAGTAGTNGTNGSAGNAGATGQANQIYRPISFTQ